MKTAEEIVRALDQNEPLFDGSTGDTVCGLCGQTQDLHGDVMSIAWHDPDCEFRLASECVDATDGRTRRGVKVSDYVTVTVDLSPITPNTPSLEDIDTMMRIKK